MSDLEMRERSLVEREELERLKKDLERREEDLEKAGKSGQPSQ